MPWFPEDQDIPKDSNVRPDIESFVTALTCLESDYQDTSDITFMIPVGLDSMDRLRNLTLCVTRLLLGTDSKIHIYWSQTNNSFTPQDSINYSLNEMVRGMFAVGRLNSSSSNPQNFVRLFKRCSYGEVVSDEDNKSINDIFCEMVFQRIDSLKVGDSLSLKESVALMTTGGPAEANKTYRPESLYSTLRNLIYERVKITLELRPDNEPFHRTKYLNRMLSSADTSYVVNHDADIILPVSSIKKSVAVLKQGCDFVYPYGYGAFQKRVFLEEPSKERLLTEVALTGDISRIENSNCCIDWPAAYGQSIFANTQSYKDSYGENEQFVSWGAEDVERYVRWVKLDKKVARLNSSIVYHLEHSRGPDSGATNPAFNQNESLWEHIQLLQLEDLKAFYSSLEYITSYDWGKNDD